MVVDPPYIPFRPVSMYSAGNFMLDSLKKFTRKYDKLKQGRCISLGL